MSPGSSHEHVIPDGPAGYLENPLIHHDYKGMERYFERHNVYSSLEAVEARRTLTAPNQRPYVCRPCWGPGAGAPPAFEKPGLPLSAGPVPGQIHLDVPH